MTRRGLTALLALTMAIGLSAPAAKAADPLDGQPRIVGGGQSAPGQWPWQVALLHANTANTYDGFFCGGTVISRSWVMTAAHCTIDPDTGAALAPSAINVLVDTNVLGDKSGHRLRVAFIRRNPAYKAISNENDVALLRLAKPTAATAIPVVSESQRSLWAAGKVATVSGWGSTNPDVANAYPTHLRHATVPLQSDATCGAKYPASRGPGLTFFAASMVCAGPLTGGRDTCFGDSGGPLVVPGSGGKGWVQVGITSWGAGCALADNPGVYSRLGVSSMAGFVSSTERFGPFNDASSFIARQFLDFVHRSPSASELSTWRTRINSESPGVLIAKLESSSTWQAHAWEVARLHRTMFLRDPDTGGLGFLIGARFAGVPVTSLASSFAAWPEFTKRYGQLSDGAFVDLVYRNVLGRAPDAAGRSSWLHQLASGVTRSTVMVRFSDSYENRAKTYSRIRAITTWFGLIRVVPPTAQINAVQAQPIATLVDMLRLSYSYALRF